MPEGHRKLSRMLDLNNESTDFMSLAEHVSHVDDIQIFSAYNTQALIVFLIRTINFLLSHLDAKLFKFLASSNNLVQGEDMFNNMPTVDINFGYDTHMQSYPSIMNYSSL